MSPLIFIQSINSTFGWNNKINSSKSSYAKSISFLKVVVDLKKYIRMPQILKYERIYVKLHFKIAPKRQCFHFESVLYCADKKITYEI